MSALLHQLQPSGPALPGDTYPALTETPAHQKSAEPELERLVGPEQARESGARSLRSSTARARSQPRGQPPRKGLLEGHRPGAPGGALSRLEPGQVAHREASPRSRRRDGAHNRHTGPSAIGAASSGMAALPWTNFSDHEALGAARTGAVNGRRGRLRARRKRQQAARPRRRHRDGGRPRPPKAGRRRRRHRADAPQRRPQLRRARHDRPQRGKRRHSHLRRLRAVGPRKWASLASVSSGKLQCRYCQP